MKRLLATIAFIAIAAPAQAQTVEAPREVAEQIAQAVETNFYDAQRAQTIAAEVRQNASAGRYDLANPADFAAALTATLSPHDGHFRVEYTPPGAGASGGGNAVPGVAARGNYGVPSATMYPGGVGVIDIRLFAHFNPADSAPPEKQAIDAALTMTAGADALVFDMRDCAGGSPVMVGYLAAHFAAADADIYNTFRTRGGDANERPLLEPAMARRLETPLFMLISGRTGSACESFAYTLQAAGRATVVGEASAGAANPGGYIPLGQGLAVFVSAGTPVNPITGRNWEGAGVQPDVAAPTAQSLTRARQLALEAIIANPGSAGADVEARWALDALNAESRAAPRGLDAYAGNYGPRSVRVEDGGLVLHRDRRPGLALLPLAERDHFAVAGAAPQQRVRFERDARGRISAMVLTLITGQEIRDLRAN
ncbi:MAG: S41 family peptidase [Hyphomonadaceae bacterium]